MKILKKIAVFLLVLLIGMQFIRPEKNISMGPSTNNITNVFPVSDTVRNIFEKSCYDCHSNNTKYPWYSNIQPVASWLHDHIEDGKDEINFDEFATYRIGRQYRKLLEIKEQLDEDEMPLGSYTLIHKDAKLTGEQKTVLLNWVESQRSLMRTKYPADSLVTKRKPS